MVRQRLRIVGLAVVMAGGLVMILSGCLQEAPDVDFQCDEHEQCLDDEACLGDRCEPAPDRGDQCPSEHEGEHYEGLTCTDGQWQDGDRPDAPEVVRVHADPETADPGEMIELTVDVDAPDDADLTYQWTVDDEGWELTDDDQHEARLEAHQDPGEEATVEVEVTDGYDQSDTGEVTVSTSDPGGPTIHSLTADPPAVAPGENQQIIAEVSHPDGDELDYDWTIPEGWTATGDDALLGPEPQLIAPDEPEQSGTVELTVTDEDDRSASSQVDVETLGEDAPTITFGPWADTEMPVELGDPFNVEVDAENATSYQWSSEGNWDIANSTAPTANVTAPDHTETEDIVVTIGNEEGVEITASLEVYTYDYEPDPIEFEDQSDVMPNSVVESDVVEITGIDAELDDGEPLFVDADCENCEVRPTSEDAWFEDLDDVQLGDELQIRMTAPDSFGESDTATLTVGDTESDPWEVTTVEEPEWEFSTCGSSGREGPSQSDCDDEYEGDPLLDGFVTIDDNEAPGIQRWTVPVTGTYRIKAWGAEGDDYYDNNTEESRGAYVSGEISLDAGDELRILVGQRGEYAQDQGHAASGGGGSFVVDEEDAPLAVAGGGGGNLRHNHDNRHGDDGEAGRSGQTSGDGNTEDGGEDGEGGDGSGGSAGSGGGLISDGGGSFDREGLAFMNGGQGGDADAEGGFGGGGGAVPSADNNRHTCGGGGGYSGGGRAAGTESGSYCSGGGGGSKLHDDADLTSGQTGDNTGDGAVTIEWIDD